MNLVGRAAGSGRVLPFVSAVRSAVTVAVRWCGVMISARFVVLRFGVACLAFIFDVCVEARLPVGVVRHDLDAAVGQQYAVRALHVVAVARLLLPEIGPVVRILDCVAKFVRFGLRQNNIQL